MAHLLQKQRTFQGTTLDASRQAAGAGALTVDELLAGTIAINTTAGALVFELPDMTNYGHLSGLTVEFKVVTGGNTADIDANTTGGILVDGANTAQIASLPYSLTFVYDHDGGVAPAWHIVGSYN